MEESTRLQSIGLEVVILPWTTFLEDATYADLHVGREEGRIVGIKSLLEAVWITAASTQLVLLVNISVADELQRKYAK
ncbi:hypothetical protein Tco_1160698 [Tanacetum coccineum]